VDDLLLDDTEEAETWPAGEDMQAVTATRGTTITARATLVTRRDTILISVTDLRTKSSWPCGTGIPQINAPHGDE